MTTSSFYAIGANVVVSICLLGVVPHIALSSENIDVARELLRANGVNPDASGAVAYLRQQLPNADVKSEIAALILLLDADTFDMRSEASIKLSTFGVSAERQLLVASKSGNAEVVYRARQLLMQLKSSSEVSRRRSILIAALQLLKEEPLADAVPVLVEISATISTPYIGNLASEAIWSSTNRSHAELLTKALEHENERIQSAAIVALELAIGKEALPAIKGRLTSKHESVRLAAARAVVDHEPRAALSVLKGLVASKNQDILWKADSLLQALTGHRADIVEDRTLAQSWNVWLDKHADSLELKTPLGKARLSNMAGGNLYQERFSLDVKSVRQGYGRFLYEGPQGLGGSVRDNVLRLDGSNVEADQRLVLESSRLTGHATWPRKFEIRARMGGDSAGSGGYHVGISIGHVKILFHPSYSGGGFRVEDVKSHKYYVTNQTMPFRPTGGALCPISIKVERTEKGAKFDIKIEPPKGAGGKPFSIQYTATNQQLGKFDRIGLERSGRKGGDALFDSFELRRGE